MTTNFSVTPTNEITYREVRALIIELFEGLSLGVYIDSVGLPTIGIGWNLAAGNGDQTEYFLNDVLNIESGDKTAYKEGHNYSTLLAALQRYTTQTYQNGGLLENVTAQEQTLIDNLNVALSDALVSPVAFAFSSKQAARDFLNGHLGDFENRLERVLADVGVTDNYAPGVFNFPASRERLALLSLIFGSTTFIKDPDTDGPTPLAQALIDNNRAEAWFRIRYRSNGGASAGPGIAKRRYFESALFSPFANPENVSKEEAESFIAFLNSSFDGTQTRLQYMIGYENNYWGMAEDAIIDYRLNSNDPLNLKEQLYFQDILKPLAPYLIDHYLDGEGTGLEGANYRFDGDVVLGFTGGATYKIIDSKGHDGIPGQIDKSDLLIATNNDVNNILEGNAGDDFLIGAAKDDELKGGDGNDVLVGKGGADKLTGGKGNDLLLGGAGNDTYLFEGNFGTDIIKDADGNGTISIAGFTGSFTSVQGSDIIFRDAANKFEAIKINNGSSTDLLITSLSDETTGNVLIKNWNPGNLGISLTIDSSTPSAGNAATVNGDGGNNAITLDNLRDNNPTLDLSSFTALYADGGSGNDIIMGMLNGNDTLLGGDGDDIISGGFTTTLGDDASKTFQSVAAVPGADSIDGGAGNDFIFSAAGGSVAHGGEGNDILVSTGPAYFQFNHLNEVLADESRGITGHRALTRDEIYADALSRMNFGVEKDGLNYTLNNSYFKDFTSSYAEYNSAIENVKFIGKSGSTASNHSNGDVSYGFAGSYTLTYDYSNNGALTPLSTDNPSPLTMAISTFAPGAGKTLEDFANIKGANLFGDAGDDYLEGGIYADYLSGGADNDVVFAGAGNDIIDGGDGNDTLYGEEGRDIIIGGKGDDILAGGDENDLLVGGEGSDGFVGGDGDDTLVGGVEDQYFSGGAGNNIYIIEDIVFEEADVQAAANNQDPNTLGYASLVSQTSTQSSSPSSAPLLTIESTEGNNTLALVGVSSLDQINLTAQNNDLILHTGNAAIFIRDGLDGAVDHLALGDSVDEFTDSATSAKSTTIDEVMLARLSTEVTRTAQSAGTQLAGGLLNDTLTAHAGGSTLIGGQSDDTLLGNVGDDIYVIRAGDGFDSITEQGGTNTIKLTEGITADQLALRRTNGNLLLIISNNQSVVVNGMFNESTGEIVVNKAIHSIEFSNGEIWDLTRVLQESAQGVTLAGGDHNDLLVGYESSDTLIGGKGNDTLRGDKGDDHYHFAIGDGADRIDDNNGSDHIYFAEGISEAQVSLRKDTSNNLIIRINNTDSITVLNAFNAADELTAQAIEHIHFNNTVVWDLARIQTELAKNQAHVFIGSENNDVLHGDNASQIFNGNQGDDQLNGGNANDVYQYALGDGKDVIKDINGNDRLALLAGINENEVVARRDGDNLVLTLKDGGSITVQNTFGGVKEANIVDSVITTLIEQLQSRWMSQAEELIEQHYGLTGSGDIALGFENGLEGAEAAHVEGGAVLKLVIDLGDFSNPPNGVFPHYYDRIIAHEMVHAVMIRNMNLSGLPGWFTEGTAEFIHGADERVKGDANIIGLESNFNQLFKTTAGSPSTSAGYSVSYIAVKLLDKEIRNRGGVGIREVFDHLKTGKTLDQSLIAVSAAHSGLAAVWNNLSSFETHFKAVGFAQYTQLLTLDNVDTGSIAGSDYGHASLNASAVIPETLTGPSQHFNLVIPEEYVSTPEVNGVVESIVFNSGNEWDFTRVMQEVLKPTDGDDTIHAFGSDDILSGSKGNDHLFGYAGNDIYRYTRGDGNDVIIDSAGTDQIEFGEGILATEIELSRDSLNNLIITLKDRSTITVRDAFTVDGQLSSSSIEFINFANGDIWNSPVILQEVNRVRANIILGTDGKDFLTGSVNGDILIGGLGDDTLVGGGGDDIYRYQLGDGKDAVRLASGNSEFWFDEGILPNEISLRKRPYASLLVTFKDGGSIEMENLFSSDRNPMFRFSNGESWNISEIKRQTLLLSSTENNDTIQGFLDDDTINGYGGSDYINGLGGDDVITGGLGSDRLDGEEGNDSYHYSLGDGVDTIKGSYGIDRLILGAGVNEEDVNLLRTGVREITVTFRQGGSVILEEMFVVGALSNYENEGAFSNFAALEKIIFSNGIEWGLDTIKEKLKPIVPDANGVLWGFDSSDVIDGLSGDDEIYGLSGHDTLTGGGGNDILNGGPGNDQLTGGPGVDHLYGGEGDDRYIVNAGEGYKFISDSGGNDVLQFDVGIDPEELMVSKVKYSQGNFNHEELIFHNRKGQFVVVDLSGYYTWGAVKNIERVEFANGDIWNATILQEKITYTESLANVAIQKDTSYSFSPVLSVGAHITGIYAEYIHGGSGNDTLASALTGDVIVAMKGREGIDSFIINHGVRRILDFDYNSEHIVFSNVFSLNDLDFHVTNNYSFQSEYNPRSILHLKDKTGNATVQIGVSMVGYDDSYHNSQALNVNSDPAANKFIVLADGTSHSFSDLLALKNIATNGDDNISLLSDSDIVDADAGNDFVSGGSGDDTLSGGDGNDLIYGGFGNDHIDGGDGNDELTGGYGDDYIAGGTGSDTLDGVYGMDTLEGGAGDDLLCSRRYHDDLAGYDAERIKTTYIYRLGDGNDTIIDRDGEDKIIFGQGITADDIEFEQIRTNFSSVDHLLIKIRQGGSILVQEALSNGAPAHGFMEQIEFAGGVTWDKNTIATKIWGTDDVPPPMPTAEFNSLGTIVIGYAEVNSLVEIKSSNGVVLGSVTADSTSGAYSVTLASALINKETVNVTAKDAAGNTSEIKAIIAPDKTAPALPSANFDSAGKVISGTAEAGSVVVVKNANNTSTLGTVTADATTGAYSITLVAALINKETVNITATDAAVNVSIVRAIVAPDGVVSNPASIIIQAENYTSMSGVWNEPTTDVGGGQDTGNINTGDWMAYNNAAFSVPVEGRYKVTYRVASLNGGGRLALKELSNESTLGSIAIPKTGAWQSWVDVTQEITLSAGEHNFKIYAENGGFNVNWFKLEPVTSVAPDTMPPAQPTAIFDSVGKVITGVAEAGSVVVIKNANNTSTLGTVTADAITGAYSITLTTALINKEPVNVTATDAAGNISAIRVIIAPDKTAPSAPTASFDATGKVITGVAEAGSTVSVKNAAGAELKTVTANATTGEYSITLTTALINKETVNITATDAAGNISVARTVIAPDVTAPNPASIIIQAENYTSMSGVWNEPTTDVGGGQDTGNINTGDWMAYNNAAFSVPVEGRYKVTYRVASLNGGGRLALKELSNESTLGSIAIPKTGAWQSWVDVTQEITLSAGEHNFKIYAENGGFNVNWFKLEPVTSVAPDTTPPAQPTAIFDSVGKVITGVAEAGSVVVVKNTNNTSTLGTVTADATTGAYSITLATALINKETVNVTATDVAGNISAIKAIIAPDKTAPIAPTVTLDVTSKIVSGVAEAGSSVTVKDSTGQTLGVVQANATSGAYSVSFTQTLIHGQSIFTTATDGAGNISVATTTPIVINNTPIQAGNGLRGSYYGYHQPTNGNVDLTNLNQVLGLIGNRTPDATFIAKNIQYGRSGPTALGMGINLQNFLKTDAASLSRDPGDTSDAILRFDGKIQLSAGTYNFRVRADDGYSIKVNGMTVAEYALNQAATTRTHASFTIAQSGLQDFEIIYWDSGWDHILNVELANTATGNYAYISEGILFQPTPIEPIAMTSATHVLDADYGRVHYYNRNDALIQAMASFDPAAGMDTRYRAVSVDQHHLVLAVGS